MEDHRADCHDGMDSGNLEEGAGDMGFDPNDYEGASLMVELPSLPSTTASLLTPHVKAPGLHTIMNSSSSDATPVMRLGTSLTTAQSAYRL